MLGGRQLRQVYDEQIGYHAVSPKWLVVKVGEAMQHGITKQEQAFIDDVLPPELRGHSGEAHADALRTIAAKDLVR
jgi:hypothetical protein